MKQDKWIKELDQETFDLPINIKYDNEYFGTIQNKFDELIQVFQQNSAPNYIIEITKHIQMKFCRQLTCIIEEI